MPVSARDRRWKVLAVLCVAVFLVVVDNTVVNVALPRRGRRLCHEVASLLALAVFSVINMVTFAILTAFSGAVPFRMLFHQVANGS